MGLLDLISQIGIAPYGFRYIDSPSEIAMPKGKGYFGGLLAKDNNLSTEISATTDIGSFPLLVPTLTKNEVELLLKEQEPTEEILKKAEDFAKQRISMGLDPFASPFELRMPISLLD
jgi:hypothetical protein